MSTHVRSSIYCMKSVPHAFNSHVYRVQIHLLLTLARSRGKQLVLMHEKSCMIASLFHVLASLLLLTSLNSLHACKFGMLHAICRFFKSNFSKSYFRNTIRISYSLDLDLGLIWVQTVCKSYQQATFFRQQPKLCHF